MPKWLHDQLARSGRKRGLKGDRLKAYIYSVLNKYKKAHGEGREKHHKKERGRKKVAMPGR